MKELKLDLSQPLSPQAATEYRIKLYSSNWNIFYGINHTDIVFLKLLDGNTVDYVKAVYYRLKLIDKIEFSHCNKSVIKMLI